MNRPGGNPASLSIRPRAVVARRVLVVPLLLSSVWLAAACRADPAPVPDSGISGVVLAGPQCPVVTAESPCPDVPWAGVVRVTGEDGDVVEVSTDEQGRFEVPLAPAVYRIEAVIEGGGPPSASPQDVAVTADAFVQVTLTVDTGIR